MMNTLRSTRIRMLTAIVQHSFWHKSKQKRSVISFLSNWHSLQKRSLGTNFSLNLDELIEVERRKMSFEESSMVSGTRRTDERHESKVFLTEYYTSCILQNWCCHWFCVKLSISGFRSLVLFLPQFLWLVQSDHTACKRIDKEWFLWKYQLLSRDRQTIDFFSLLKQYKEEMTKEKRFLSQVSRCEERRTEWKWKCLFWFNQAMISCSFFFFFFSYMSDHKAYIYDSFVCLMCKHKHTNLTSFPSSSLSSPDACPSGSFLG